MDKETILAAIRNDIDAAESYFDSVIKPKLIERYQIYESDKSYYEKLFPKLSKRSSFTSTDVADTIEWAMPSLMRIFFGGEEVITIKGRQAEDDRKAELMQALINFQVQVQNPGFMIFYRWFKDALIGGLGVIKCWWEREYEEVVQKTVFSKDELNLLKQHPNVEVLAVEDLGNGLYYAVSYKTKKLMRDGNKPVFVNIPPTEFLYHPDASTISESTFVAHRKVVTADYLRRRAEEGLYDKEAVEEAIQRGLAENSPYSLDSLEVAIRPNQSKFTFPSTQDEARKYFTLYECYTKLDIDGDGLLEPVIVTVVNDVILRLEENLYGRPPFFVLSPVIEPYEIWGKGFADVISDIQALKTALIRQILVNVALNNDPKVFVDTTKVNIADLVSDNAFIRVQGSPINTAVFPLPTHPLAPWTYNLLEYLEALKENRTGITRYNQGLDARSLNKRIDINTPVPMADGTWKLLKDIQDGDIILGGDGKPTKVIKAHEIAWCEDAYELEFSNGAKIKADAEHLWGCYFHGRYRIVTTKEIYEALQRGTPVYVPRASRIYSGKEKELPIDPYVLGVWLGDGHKYSARITVSDDEIYERVKKWCEEQGWQIKPDKHQNAGKATTYIITSCAKRIRDENGRFVKEDGFHRRLDELGIYPRTGGEPHIPAIYFTASYEQRLELLRGLMDTDGCWSDAGVAIFCTSNRRLAEDVARLVRSLGGNPHIRLTRKAGKEICVGRLCNVSEHWHVNFNLLDCPFYVKRKAEKWRPIRKAKTYRVVAVKKTDPCYMRCLTVDNPDGLWLVGGHYITTHNTATGIQLIMSAANQRLELIARIFAETGIKEFFRFLIGLNQRFITEDVVIRLTGQELTITPDDLQGYFDLEINAGVGVGVKEQTLQNIQMLLQLYPQLLELGIATPKNVYNVMKKFVETLGFKNVADFITNPEEVAGGTAGIQAAIGGNPEEVSQELVGQGSAPGVQGISGGAQEDLIRALAEQLGRGMAGNQGETGGAG